MKTVFILFFLAFFEITSGQTTQDNYQIKLCSKFYKHLYNGELDKCYELIENSTKELKDSIFITSEMLNNRKEFWCLDSIQFIKSYKKNKNDKVINTYVFKQLSTKCQINDLANNQIEFYFFQDGKKIFYLSNSKTTEIDGKEILTENKNSINLTKDTVVFFKDEKVIISETRLLNLSFSEVCFNINLDYSLPFEVEEKNKKALQIAEYIGLIYVKNETYQKANNLSYKLNKTFRDKILVTFLDNTKDFNLEVKLGIK